MDFKSNKINLEIPVGMKDDITYCQSALRHYIKVHQLCAVKLNNNPMNEGYARCLRELEEDIRDIVKEQKYVINQLRKLIEIHHSNEIVHQNVPLDRDIYNAYLSKLFLNHFELSFPNIIPVTVQRRLTDFELMTKYNLTIDNLSPKNYQNLSNSSESSSPSLSLTPTPIAPKQVSLLKPKSERVRQFRPRPQKKQNLSINPFAFATPNDISFSQQQNKQKNVVKEPEIPKSLAIKNSRLNLLQALNKAKTQSQSIPASRTRRSSSSSESSRDNSPPPLLRIQPKKEELDEELHDEEEEEEEIFMPRNIPDEPEPEPIVHNQESFLRLFGLYTHEYSNYLATRRPERRRRNVQSTEKTDFHYGHIDFFQLQKNNKRKKPLLYSPPATRALKKRKHFDEVSIVNSVNSVNSRRSSSSSPPNGEAKQCVVCNKNGDSIKNCESCLNYFHEKCHSKTIMAFVNRTKRLRFCPACIKNQRKREQVNAAQVRDKKLCNKLQKKNTQLHDFTVELWNKYDTLENALFEQADKKRELLKAQNDISGKMKKLVNFISSIKDKGITKGDVKAICL